MSISLSERAKNAGCLAITSLVDVGTLNSNGYISIYTAPRPSTTDSSSGSATRLAIVPLASPSFGTVSNGEALALGLNTSGVTVEATGTASWYRIFDKDNNPIWDGDIGLTSSGSDMEFNDLNFIKDGKVVVASFKAKMP